MPEPRKVIDMRGSRPKVQVTEVIDLTHHEHMDKALSVCYDIGKMDFHHGRKSPRTGEAILEILHETNFWPRRIIKATPWQLRALKAAYQAAKRNCVRQELMKGYSNGQ